MKTAHPWGELADSLRGSFRGRSRGAEDVEDLVQETFVRVHASLAELRDSDRLEAWVRRIAEHVWIDARRREHPHGQLPDEVEDARDDGGGPDPTREAAGWLADAIDALDPVDREVLRRTELGGERQRDVAADLGLSLTAVKSRVRRGRAKLRARLEACCRFEFDRRGGLIDVRRRAGGECGCE